VWRYYNGRSDCENVIKELSEGFALPMLCLEKFWATEATLSLAVLTYNLSVLFQRHLGCAGVKPPSQRHPFRCLRLLLLNLALWAGRFSRARITELFCLAPVRSKTSLEINQQQERI
jgi:hypothetical protein